MLFLCLVESLVETKYFVLILKDSPISVCLIIKQTLYLWCNQNINGMIENEIKRWRVTIDKLNALAERPNLTSDQATRIRDQLELAH